MNFSGNSYDMYDLMQMFTPHLTHYKLILERIQSFSEQSERKGVEKSARHSVDLMSDIVKHVEKYVEDSQNLSDIRKLMNKISFRPSNIESYGFLRETLEVSKLKLLDAEDEHTNVTMLCFEKKILFYNKECSGVKRKYIKSLKISHLHVSLSR
jgi:hypothetical protein